MANEKKQLIIDFKYTTLFCINATEYGCKRQKNKRAFDWNYGFNRMNRKPKYAHSMGYQDKIVRI
ncbi:hypothetical protein GCM10027442_13450 [Emticicia fontis]